MNARTFLFTNIRLAVGFCGVALASRTFRYFEYKGQLAAPWLAVSRDLMARGEHIFAGVGLPALLVAFTWFCWATWRTRNTVANTPAMRFVDEYAPAIAMFTQAIAYIVYAGYWEFFPHGNVGMVSGTLANQFACDVYGVTAYFTIMTQMRGFASTKALCQEVSQPGFHFFLARSTGVTVEELEGLHQRYPKLGFYIAMREDGAGGVRPQLAFIWDGEEVCDPSLGLPWYIPVDPRAEYGISKSDAATISKLNGCC